MKQPTITIGKDIVQLVAEIDEFKKQWRSSKLPADRLQQLRKDAFVESVGASTRIAGVTLTNAQVEALLSKRRLLEEGPKEAAGNSTAEDYNRDEAQVGAAELSRHRSHRRAYSAAPQDSAAP
jgi:hypothetical protein